MSLLTFLCGVFPMLQNTGKVICPKYFMFWNQKSQNGATVFSFRRVWGKWAIHHPRMSLHSANTEVPDFTLGLNILCLGINNSTVTLIKSPRTMDLTDCVASFFPFYMSNQMCIITLLFKHVHAYFKFSTDLRCFQEIAISFIGAVLLPNSSKWRSEYDQSMILILLWDVLLLGVCHVWDRWC